MFQPSDELSQSLASYIPFLINSETSAFCDSIDRLWVQVPAWTVQSLFQVSAIHIIIYFGWSAFGALIDIDKQRYAPMNTGDYNCVGVTPPY